jgi:NitT/TauT family transport system ATP-binding protein
MTGFNLEGLSKSFGSHPVLDGLDLQIPAGEFVSVVGPSGCGKSTFLRILAGLEKPSRGSFHWDSKAAPRASFVFQEANLLPWRDLFENVRLPFELDPELALPQPEIRRRVQESLHQVQLGNLTRKFPHELSGGMKMRASIARALVNAPELLLMDEPFAALDEITRFQLQEQLHQIWSRQKITAIFVTHTLSEAVFLSQRVLILKKGRFVVDTAIELPPERNETLRQSPAYQKEVTRLAQLFRREYV